MIGLRLVLAALLALPLAAAERWIRLSTSNFELYTNDSEAVGRETIRTCERLRRFYEQLPEYRQKQLAPVRIVGFSSKEQFRSYQSVAWEAGHYETNGNRDWIALGPAANPAMRAAMQAHEYHHMVAARAGLRLPHWLSEGLAEFYSTLTPAGNKTMAGHPIAHHLETLQASNWLSLRALATVDDQEFRALTGAGVHLFYAESWIVVQFLSTSPEYGPNFPKLLAAANEGRPVAEAFERAFGRSVEVVEKDVRSYLGQKANPAREFPERMESADELAIDVTAIGDFEVALVLTDLLSVMRKEDEAKRAFAALNGRFAALDEIQRAPESRAATLAGMYFHAARAGWNPKQANTELLASLEGIFDLPQVQRAAPGQEGTTAEVYYQFALVEKEAHAPLDKVATSLRRTFQLQPDHEDAKIKLGELYLESNRLEEAAAAFMKISPASKAASYAVNGLHGVAAGYLSAGSFAEARRAVEDGRKWVRTLGDSADTDRLLVAIAQRSAAVYLESGDLALARASLDGVQSLVSVADDRQEAERLRGLIEARSKGKLRARPGEKLVHVEGIAVALDCPAAGPLLRVRLDSAERMFDLPDPSAIEISSSGTGELELHCGVLKRFRIAVDYAAPGVASPKSSGIVRKIRF